MRVTALLVLLTLTGTAKSQPFSMDDYQIRWTIMGVGNTELRIMKSPQNTFINIYRSNGITSAAVRMSPEDAVLVAQALERTQEIFDSQQNTTENVAESIDTGNYEVTFRTSVFNGFSVVIQEKNRFNDQFSDRYGTNAVTLPLQEALGITTDLHSARELADYLDSQVAF